MLGHLWNNLHCSFNGAKVLEGGYTFYELSIGLEISCIVNWRTYIHILGLFGILVLQSTGSCSHNFIQEALHFVGRFQKGSIVRTSGIAQGVTPYSDSDKGYSPSASHNHTLIHIQRIRNSTMCCGKPLFIAYHAEN